MAGYPSDLPEISFGFTQNYYIIIVIDIYIVCSYLYIYIIMYYTLLMDFKYYQTPVSHVFFGVLPMFHIYGMVGCLLISFSTGSNCITFTKFDPQLYIGSLIKYKVLSIVPKTEHCFLKLHFFLPLLNDKMATLIVLIAVINAVIRTSLTICAYTLKLHKQILSFNYKLL